MKTGCLIVAAKGDVARPMTPVGDSTVIRRIIITMKQAGIEPVVVVTGQNGDELEKHVARLNVIFLRNEDYGKTQMFDSIRMGLSYMSKLCGRVFVLPAKFPLFLPLTIRRMTEERGPVVCPTYGGRGGHPVLISSSVIPRILAYQGDMGLKGAIRQLEDEGLVTRVAVEDMGTIQSVESLSPAGQEVPLKEGEQIPVSPDAPLILSRNEKFFDPAGAQFLFLIQHTGSIRTACRQMHMSYTKGWAMIKEAQEQLGFPILETQSGGAKGGSSRLTLKAQSFLERYMDMARQLREEAGQLFELYFPELCEHGGGHENTL